MGIGGEFIATLYINKTIRVLDSREIAPLASNEDMFEEGNVSSTTGGMAVAVPGALRGYEELHTQYGVMPWAELVKPSIELCENGFEVTKFLVRCMKRSEHTIKAEASLRDVFINPERNKLWLEGDIIKRPKLARTLEIIARDGASVLYNGTLTKKIVHDIRERNGIITIKDMHQYRPFWLDPLSFELDSNTIIYTVPLPGSGHLKAFIVSSLKDWVFLNKDVLYKSTVYWQRIVEIFKYASAQRVKLGDPNFLDFNYVAPILANLTSTDYAKHIISLIRDDVTYNDWKHYAVEFGLVEDHGTAHLTILGPNGDAISVTSSVNHFFGASFISNSTRILLNNEMDDFSIPGDTNVYGMPPSPANFVKPRKKPLSSMVPTIVLDKANNVRLLIGAAGGTKILTQVAIVMMKHLLRNIPLIDAIGELRLHHQLFPMEIQHEPGFNQRILEELRKIGHNTMSKPTMGSVIGITVDPKTKLITGVYDERRTGSVAGF